MIKPTLEEVKRFAAQGQYRILPVSREIYADIKTPIEVLRILQAESHHCFLLESAESKRHWGRYTFLGFDPKQEITCADGEMCVRGETEEHFHTQDPGAVLKKILAANKSPRFSELPPFTGGLVGYFSYDYVKYSEPELKLDAEDQENFNDVDLMLFDRVIAFDHFRQKIVLIANIRLDGNVEAAYADAQEELKYLANLIRNGTPAQRKPGRMTSPVRHLFTKEAYCQMVERAKQYIREGDIFQAVLSNRLDADFEGSLLNTYRVLRTLNPSPYMFYFSSDDIEIAGASPETLVKLDNGVLQTFPLAGSRPRGETEEQDRQLEHDLLTDPKELAEHNMLVDLGRNDLGRISEFGSVKVERHLQVLRFSHIMHLGSTVTGTIKDGFTAPDVIGSVLPAGTLSGAPKFRACQIINELENNRRGIYGGAIGYLDFTGNLDTCIAIRIAFKKNGKVFVRSGAGIVADSIPEQEYQECINKAKAVVAALQEAQEEIDDDSAD
ncbi:anthranilate synthase component I [Caproicibacterium lactatifermentans]|uniref:Anthranilate synthase component 1 n=1 Tax=Caproicibacterium lactatifermentans TaxID=2666138 RepID=A0A859DS48_9FIRM|nr:anthranilate synthase component I [Caproicibacterium lactatifermentans]QKN24285.1 anthranilate synthase component I [Caproicibacterium lactatifermentans]